ncbi:MAG: DUF4388 domain-containing protein [Sandaracinaceae bacterium]
MLSGDLSTMSLPDLLQWIDAHRMRALVTVTQPGADQTWLLVDDRTLIAGAAPIARGMLATDGTPSAPGPGLSAVTLEGLLDIFMSNDGRFTMRKTESTPTGAVPLETPIQFLLMEGLRLLDEWPRIDAAYPTDAARVAATEASAEVDRETLGAVQRAILEIAHEAPALGEARLVLGLSRPALLRNVDELRARGWIDVEGTPHGPDVETSLIRQARVLVREGQYAEAAHVFRSLLTSNPRDVRLKALLDEAEHHQVEALYRRFAPTDIVSVATAPSRPPNPAEGAVLEQLARPRSVAVLSLVSPLREVETLHALARLIDRGTVHVESAE